MKVYLTTVVNIKYCPDFDPNKNPNDVYIDRFHRSSKYGVFQESKWHNPFNLREWSGLTRDSITGMYKTHIHSRPELIASLHELKGKRLGCWCKPESCHGDILAKLSNEEQDR